MTASGESLVFTTKGGVTIMNCAPAPAAKPKFARGHMEAQRSNRYHTAPGYSSVCRGALCGQGEWVCGALDFGSRAHKAMPTCQPVRPEGESLNQKSVSPGDGQCVLPGPLLWHHSDRVRAIYRNAVGGAANFHV